ncbi:c-type cytochrome [Luteolibacter pohnpeiensis]|uniref:C-type cytochrome n=1 Tax=Luteolibacter pohnpeiensis TaxID=454153 RepID=A0A934VPH3_9BACT|nr:c-type cytochrome [Luteolibacter pohnpeiensis]MBK1881001.1 c-type cytochrome [Luteolibacter pohnpeiensis]
MRFPFLAFCLLAATAKADLIATFSKDGVTDARRDRFPALSIKPGEPATPFLGAGAFEVTWTGKLVLSQRQRVSFSFEGEGAAALKVDDKELLSKDGTLSGEGSKTTRLNAGEHDITITYKSKADGTAAFRFYWESSEMPRQTVPPDAFAASESEAATLGEDQRSGRLLFAQQNCSKCHVSSTGSFGANGMVELSEIGPVLAGIADRVTEDWLKNWIADPKSIKPTTHMPTLVDASTKEGLQEVADLAAYLTTTQKLGMPTSPKPDPQLAQAGGVHFQELGCVACHTMPGVEQPDLENKRVPLNNVAFKFQPGALVDFLKNPHQFYSAIGMPDFRLSDEEANSLAAFLRTSSEGKETKPGHQFPKGDATRGAEIAGSLQCGVCHPGLPMTPSAVTSLDDLFTKDWTAVGCVAAADKRGKAPVLNLSDEDRSKLVTFSKSGKDSLFRNNVSEFATRQLESQRCVNCHLIDGKPPLLSSTQTETASLTEHVKGLHERVDQSRPQLTFIGEMLYTDYIEAMLSGTEDPRPRPWLGMRMPSFHAHPKELAEGLSRLHGFEPSGPQEVKVDPKMAEIGKDLASASGFGCVTCHAIGDQKATAIFEVEGINLKLASSRLREGYYHRWMDNPPSVTPSTKMPRFSDGNESQRADVLDGDAWKQYDAIWQYLHSLDGK